MTADRKGARRRGPWWLIVEHEGGLLEAMALRLAGGERVVPVFSFEEEAELFLRFEAPESGWWARETATGELASLLLSSLSGVGRVALDPLPGRLGGAAFVGLVSIGREDFVERLLMGGGKSRDSGGDAGP